MVCQTYYHVTMLKLVIYICLINSCCIFPRIISLEQKYRHPVYDEHDRESLQQVLQRLVSISSLSARICTYRWSGGVYRPNPKPMFGQFIQNQFWVRVNFKRDPLSTPLLIASIKNPLDSFFSPLFFLYRLHGFSSTRGGVGLVMIMT